MEIREFTDIALWLARVGLMTYAIFSIMSFVANRVHAKEKSVAKLAALDRRELTTLQAQDLHARARGIRVNTERLERELSCK